MKNLLLLILVICFSKSFAQDHFAGINTSKRVGILNAGINPAELVNMGSKYEVTTLALSVNISNNKIGYSDLLDGGKFEDLIFKGDDPVNLRIDAEAGGPGFAMKINEWAFAFSTKAYAKLTLENIDSKIGDAIQNGNVNSFIGSTTIGNSGNQRVIGTTWGELGFTVARNLFENDKHKFNAGVTFKLLFPGSYANLGADEFHGTIDYAVGQAYLNNAHAHLNIAYSGNLGESFTGFNDYAQSLYGPLNGFAVDLGINYRYKDVDDYKVNAGLSIRNLGAMTFKDDNNASTDYDLNIQSNSTDPFGLNLNQFDDVNSLQQIETVLQQHNYLDKQKNSQSFTVKLPTVISIYADVKIVSRFFMTLYTQQKLKQDDKNDQVTTQNVITVTPRFALKNYEFYTSWSHNEISKITGGLGLRAYGFFLGSSSIITALTNDSKQADIYIGYRFGLK